MNRKQYIIWFLLLSFLSSCGPERFPGFSETPNGLLYRLDNIVDGEYKAKTGDYVTASILIKTENDSVLYDTYKMGLEGAVTFILSPVEYAKDYREGYLFLREGDVATFITDAHTLFTLRNKSNIPPGLTAASAIKVETKVLRIRTPEQHEKEVQAEKNRLEKGEFEEKKVLDQFLRDSGITQPPVANGMYYLRMVEGKGPAIDSAKTALLNYKGCFLNGRCFDTSFEGQPFEYLIGAEDQLIPGLTAGVRRMREGEKARFIIPSHLAFGSSGSSNGMVPPFTTVIYEVELLKVQ